MRARDLILSLVSLALIGGGVTLVAAFFLGPGAPDDPGSGSEEARGFDVPVLEDTQASQAGSKTEPAEAESEAPEDETLFLTVPKMARVFEAPVPDAEGNDEEALRDYAAIHLEGTGFPWEEEANVYLAGHRLGYSGFPSFLAFYDLDNLVEGDDITLADAAGNVYSYRVVRSFFADPTDFSVTEPVEGKDLLTLQTCTLPDYSQRFVVQAEKVA